MALGTTGVLAKLLALPVFCAVVVLVRLIGRELPKHGIERFKSLLMIKVLLLALGGLLAILWGPFADGDAWRAILTGMVLVAAMAIQNAVQRVHLPKEPPTTIMTGNSTQMMIDFADLISGGLESDVRNATRARFGALARSVGAFAAGCAASAIIYVVASTSVFLLPPLIALAAALGAETRARQGA